jgi:hypothetical protein
MRTLPVALQMYTVRDEAARDFAGTLRQVAAMGYRRSSWPAPGHGRRRSEGLLDDLGLAVAASTSGWSTWSETASP